MLKVFFSERVFSTYTRDGALDASHLRITLANGTASLLSWNVTAEWPVGGDEDEATQQRALSEVEPLRNGAVRLALQLTLSAAASVDGQEVVVRAEPAAIRDVPGNLMNEAPVSAGPIFGPPIGLPLWVVLGGSLSALGLLAASAGLLLATRRRRRLQENADVEAKAEIGTLETLVKASVKEITAEFTALPPSTREAVEEAVRTRRTWPKPPHAGLVPVRPAPKLLPPPLVDAVRQVEESRGVTEPAPEQLLRSLEAVAATLDKGRRLRSRIRQSPKPADTLHGVDEEVVAVLDVMQQVHAPPVSRRPALRSLVQIAKPRPLRQQPAEETALPSPPARAAPKLKLRTVFKFAVPSRVPTEETVSAPVEAPHPEVVMEPAQPEKEDPEPEPIEEGADEVEEQAEEADSTDEVVEQAEPPSTPAPRRTEPSPIDNLARDAEAEVAKSCKMVRLNVVRRHIELLQPITFYGSKHADGVDVYHFPRTAEAICKEVAFALGVCNDMLVAQKMDALGLAVEGHTSASINGHEESVMISTGARTDETVELSLP